MTATKGLEGIVATTSSISSIIDGVLTYRGINIDKLAEHASFEEATICSGTANCRTGRAEEAAGAACRNAALPDELLTSCGLPARSQSDGCAALGGVRLGLV